LIKADGGSDCSGLGTRPAGNSCSHMRTAITQARRWKPGAELGIFPVYVHPDELPLARGKVTCRSMGKTDWSVVESSR